MKKPLPIQETPAWPIYLALLHWCEQHKAIPIERAFYYYVLSDKLPDLTLDQYRYRIELLMRAGLIQIEPTTRSLRLADLDVTIKPSVDMARYMLEMFGDEKES